MSELKLISEVIVPKEIKRAHERLRHCECCCRCDHRSEDDISGTLACWDHTGRFISPRPQPINMAYPAATDQAEASEDSALDVHHVDVKVRPDKYKTGYHEACLQGYTCRSMTDLAEALQSSGYALTKGDRFALTYEAPDGRTRIDLDEPEMSRSECRKMKILKGELTEDELPVVKQELISLFYDLEQSFVGIY